LDKAVFSLKTDEERLRDTVVRNMIMPKNKHKSSQGKGIMFQAKSYLCFTLSPFSPLSGLYPLSCPYLRSRPSTIHLFFLQLDILSKVLSISLHENRKWYFEVEVAAQKK
jgi:hypothetical protein